MEHGTVDHTGLCVRKLPFLYIIADICLGLGICTFEGWFSGIFHTLLVTLLSFYVEKDTEPFVPQGGSLLSKPKHLYTEKGKVS